MDDFAAFQRCITNGVIPVLPECGCFDRPFNGVIGLDGKIPWHIPADFAHFKRVTPAAFSSSPGCKPQPRR